MTMHEIVEKKRERMTIEKKRKHALNLTHYHTVPHSDALKVII